MGKPAEFKNKHYKAEIILLTVRWYLRYGLTCRHLTEMMAERSLSIFHTTIMRWVHEHGPKLDQKLRNRLRKTGDSYRVNEIYVRVKGKWYYLYRAVDKEGNTIDFLLSKHRYQLAAARFLKKAVVQNSSEMLYASSCLYLPLVKLFHSSQRSDVQILYV